LDADTRVEPREIGWIARHYDRALAPRNESNRGINHVRRARSPAKYAGGLGERPIERRYFGRRSVEQATESNLAPWIANHLSDDSRGHDESCARSQCFATQRSHSGVRSFERNERARI